MDSTGAKNSRKKTLVPRIISRQTLNKHETKKRSIHICDGCTVEARKLCEICDVGCSTRGQRVQLHKVPEDLKLVQEPGF